MINLISAGLVLVVLTFLGCNNTKKGQSSSLNEINSALPILFEIGSIDSVFLREDFVGRFVEKKIVGLGDATHGTHEFFVVRIEIIKALIQNQGFNLIGFEAPFSDCIPLNDFILSGNGDLDSILSQNYWWMNCTEVEELILWLKDYNESVSLVQKVKFYGIDGKSNAIFSPSKDLLRNYIGSVDASSVPFLDSVFATVSKEDFTRALQSSDPNPFLENLIIGLDSISVIVNGLEDSIVNHFSNREWNMAQLVIDNMIAMPQGLCNRDPEDDYHSTYWKRDKYMGNMVQDILEMEGEHSKMILWAHNLHIQKDVFYESDSMLLTEDGFLEDNFNQFGFDRTMGCYLDSIYGSRYHALGLLFGSGGFKAFSEATPELETDIVVGLPKEGTLEFSLNDSFGSSVFIDMTSIEESGMYGELQVVQSIPAAYFTRFVKMTPQKCFDGLVFIPETQGIKLK